MPLKRAICLYKETIGEAPEVSRGPIRNLLGWDDMEVWVEVHIRGLSEVYSGYQR